MKARKVNESKLKWHDYIVTTGHVTTCPKTLQKEWGSFVSFLSFYSENQYIGAGKATLIKWKAPNFI